LNVPNITAIIPTFSRPRLLRRAITSVLSQTYADLVLWVYDNASDDETAAVVRTFAARDARVRYHRHETNIGGFENFLYAMERVETPYFAFLSDDDALFPNCYEVCMNGFASYPDAYLSAGSTVEVDDAGLVRYAPIARWPREGRYAPPDGLFMMLDNRHPTWTAVVFRREALRDVGLLDPAVGPPSDLDYELRIAARFPVSVSFEPCAVYTHHAGSGSAREDARVAAGMTVMMENLCADPRIPSGVRAALRERLGGQIRLKLLEVCVKALVRGEDDTAAEAAQRLRERGDAPVLAFWLGCLIRLCRASTFIRSGLRAAERLRLRIRADRAKRTLRGDSFERALQALSALETAQV